MNKIRYIEIEKLEDDLWDAREHNKQNIQQERQHIEQLAKSIHRDGLLHPIVVVQKPNDKYSIVAGRFRTEACKKLGLEKIECKVFDTIDDARIASTTIAENINRLDLNVDEKIASAIRPFAIRGYTWKDIKHKCKKIHNDGTKDIEKKFLDGLEASGYAANTLYQMMQTIDPEQLNPSVQRKAKKFNLSLEKRIMLTNSKLREHPTLQKILIEKIQGLSGKKARVEVNQYIRDLETGALLHDQGSYIWDYTAREKIDSKLRIERNAGQYYLDISEKIENLMYLLTHHKLARGESYYEPNHVEYSEKHRLDILKGLNGNEIDKLENDIMVLKDALNSFIDLIDHEVIRK